MKDPRHPSTFDVEGVNVPQPRLDQKEAPPLSDYLPVIDTQRKQWRLKILRLIFRKRTYVQFRGDIYWFGPRS